MAPGPPDWRCCARSASALTTGHIAGLNALAPEPRGFARRTPLAISFSQPNAAVVGQRHADLPEGHWVGGTVDFAHQGRARVAQCNHGRLNMYAARGNGRLLAVEQRLTVHVLLRMPFYHPVLEEGLRTALRNAASHLPKASDSDLAACEAYGASALD